MPRDLNLGLDREQLEGALDSHKLGFIASDVELGAPLPLVVTAVTCVETITCATTAASWVIEELDEFGNGNELGPLSNGSSKALSKTDLGRIGCQRSFGVPAFYP